MSLQLTTITFNHDLFSAVTSGMNIRRNKDFEIPIPEYDSFNILPPEQTAAAYGIAETNGQNVVIKAHFTLSKPLPQAKTYEVKAAGGGVMGLLDPIQVTFNAGQVSKTVDIPLNHRTFSSVGLYDISWQWSYRPLNGLWQNLAATNHRIFLMLAIPPSPWSQAVGSKKNPWTDLLAFACAKAQGAQDNHTAMKKIVATINQDYQLKYDVVFGANRYGYRNTGQAFDLTHWIDYVLKGNAPAAPVFCNGSADQYKDFLIINCYDAAASLALMGEVVGSPADYYLHQPFGMLNYVEPIGRTKCNNPFYGCGNGANAALGPDDPRTGFGNHAYTKMNGKNYDACMREWLSAATKVALIIVWLIILIITFGTVNLISLLERAGGWLINLTQADYNARTIDTSTPAEAAAAGGAPALQVLDIQTA